MKNEGLLAPIQNSSLYAWVLQNEDGFFWNRRNGHFDSELSVTSHLYYDFERALEAARGSGVPFIRELVISVSATETIFPAGVINAHSV